MTRPSAFLVDELAEFWSEAQVKNFYAKLIGCGIEAGDAAAYLRWCGGRVDSLPAYHRTLTDSDLRARVAAEVNANQRNTTGLSGDQPTTNAARGAQPRRPRCRIHLSDEGWGDECGGCRADRLEAKQTAAM